MNPALMISEISVKKNSTLPFSTVGRRIAERSRIKVKDVKAK